MRGPSSPPWLRPLPLGPGVPQQARAQVEHRSGGREGLGAHSPPAPSPREDRQGNQQPRLDLSLILLLALSVEK